MCDPGFVLPLCTPCAPGFFSALTNATQCQPCPQHTFSELYAAVTCERCPYTTFTPAVGASACTPCAQANASYLETDPTACTINNPAYNNIVAMGIGMVMFIAMLVVLCRYYALRQKVKHLYFCETLRKRDQQKYRHVLQQQNREDSDADVMLRVAQDIEDNQSDDLTLTMEEEAETESAAAAAGPGAAKTLGASASAVSVISAVTGRPSPATRAAELPRHSAVHDP